MCKKYHFPLKEFLVTFLACPSKVTPKKGTRRKFFTPCSVVLTTFRKLALRAQTVRNASPSDSVAWLNFRMGNQSNKKPLYKPILTPALSLEGEGGRRSVK